MREIRLLRGQVALVDDDDYDAMSKFQWRLSKFYAITQDGPRTIRMHRLILNAPIHMEVDHINGNGLDNRRENLRLATHQQNSWNARVPVTNPLGLKGVSKVHDTRFRSMIMCRGTPIHLGYFNTAEAAHAAYKAAAEQLFGQFAATTRMIMKLILIEIDTTGAVKIEGKNFVGRECDEKMKAFEEALGTVTDRKNSPEYHQTVTTTQKVGG